MIEQNLQIVFSFVSLTVAILAVFIGILYYQQNK